VAAAVTRPPRDCSRPLGSASYRTRVRYPTPDPAPMRARPRTRQHCRYERGTRTDQAAPAQRVRTLTPPQRTDQGADQHGCDSARRTRPWSLGHRHGRLHDRVSRRGALHSDPGTDAPQCITGGRVPGDLANTVTPREGTDFPGSIHIRRPLRVERPATDAGSHRYSDTGVE
jgi:hypothetical protein